MIKFFTNNFWPKIFCLALAISIWFYVAQGEAKIANFPGNLNLNLRGVPTGLVAITDTQNVQLKISAEQAVWKTLSADNFSVYLDLNNITQGTQELSINATTNISGVQIVQIIPEKVMVRLEQVSSKTIPVNLKIEGQAGDDFVPGDSIIDPEKIELSGAKSVIDRIFEATAILKLNGETSDISKTTAALALDADGEIIKNISFSPGEVKVTLPIIKAGTSKTVGIKTKISGKPKSGYWLSSITTNPLEVTVYGAANQLKTIDYIETNEINVDGLEKNKTFQSELNVPSGLTLADKIAKVKVDIGLSENTTQKEITAGLNWTNLSQALQISTISPSVVKVVVTGTASALSELNSSNVIVNLNLINYRSSGTYNIDIPKESITAPAETTVSSFVPSSLTIILSNK